jgi:hypothetical protein
VPVRGTQLPERVSAAADALGAAGGKAGMSENIQRLEHCTAPATMWNGSISLMYEYNFACRVVLPVWASVGQQSSHLRKGRHI